MRIGLDSDFRDYYDHWFESPPCDYILNRRAKPENGISKREQFTLLESMGFKVPLHGTITSIKPQLHHWQSLVVYDDEFAHCGEGKRLLDRRQIAKAAIETPDLYCSVFMPSRFFLDKRSESLRLLAIGDRMWWLRYTSDGWMSNHADNVDVKVLEETFSREGFATEHNCNFTYLNRFPLFAIDFVRSPSLKRVAIDLNTAPGLKWTGMDDILSPSEILNLITNFVTSRNLAANGVKS